MEISVPLTYYKGYKAHINDTDGNKTELEVVKNDKNGHVLIKSEQKLTGKITVEYKMTVIQAICYSITTITILILIIYIIRDWKKRSTL